MKVEQIYTGCLAQGAYYIESNGEAVVIDPLREVQPYIEKAEKDNAKIKYVLETHFHADFVSGHLDLAKKTGATIVFGPTAKPGFEAHVAEDGEILNVGNIQIKVIHTPGHTMESTCFLLIDENGKETSLFTGDTLFIGDVGRPDLAQKVIADLTQEKLAAHLYDSLHNKIIPLADDIIVYPAHGAGSACGKNMSKETTDTLGNQKKTNYALQPMSKEKFIDEVLDGLMPPPGYFPENVLMNIKGYESIDEVLHKGTQALSPEAFETAANETDALLLDTRDAQTFSKGFIPNSINIGIDGNFAPWAGTLIPDIKQTILLIADEGREEEIVTRLARVGYDNTIGYLKGGFEAWKNAGEPVDMVIDVEADELMMDIPNDSKLVVLDVRKPTEFADGHLKNALNIPLNEMNDPGIIAELEEDQNYYVHCAGGYRSVIAASLIKRQGIHNLRNVLGGWSKIKEQAKAEIVKEASVLN